MIFLVFPRYICYFICYEIAMIYPDTLAPNYAYDLKPLKVQVLRFVCMIFSEECHRFSCVNFSYHLNSPWYSEVLLFSCLHKIVGAL